MHDNSPRYVMLDFVLTSIHVKCAGAFCSFLVLFPLNQILTFQEKQKEKRKNRINCNKKLLVPVKILSCLINTGMRVSSGGLP